MVRAYVALGSNLGDRNAFLEAAVGKLAETEGLHVVGRSRWYETRPVGGPAGQPDFLNGVVEVETELGARALLERLLAIERELGRKSRERWGPREIDCDLLLHGEEIVEEAGLVVPHPRMRERRFVLEPLAEVAPDARDPVSGFTARELLARLGGDGD